MIIPQPQPLTVFDVNQGYDTHYPTTQGLDGKAFLSFFHREMDLSFVWNGKLDEPIEVSHGGAGEPVRWYFYAGPFWDKKARPAGIVEGFGKLCITWADAKEKDANHWLGKRYGA